MEVRTQEDYERGLQLINEMDDFWLGGNENQEDEVWIWDSNDEELNGGFWGDEQPNESRAHCVELRISGFYDRICTNLRPFVCEII